MVEIIQGAFSQDFPAIIIGIFITIMAIRYLWDAVEWFCFTVLKLESKRVRERREEHELIVNTTQRLEQLEIQREIDVKESIRHDQALKEDLLNLSVSMSSINTKLDDMRAKNDETEMAKLKDKIITYYKKYKDIGEWTQMEKDAFFHLFRRYKAHGGNSFVSDVIEPIMHELNVIDD
jgi:hypothetical protein